MSLKKYVRGCLSLKSALEISGPRKPKVGSKICYKHAATGSKNTVNHCTYCFFQNWFYSEKPNSLSKGMRRNPIRFCLSYTVTRPYEGFRHPDWMAPESTVRGRENDSLVRPGFFRRFTLWKNDAMTQWRIELTHFRLLILSYTPRPQPPDVRLHKM